MKKRDNKRIRQCIALGIGSVVWLTALGQSDSLVFQRVTANRQPTPAYAPGELLVKFRPGMSVQSQQQSLQALGAARSNAVGKTGWMRVTLAPGQSVDRQMSVFQSDPQVAVVEPNYIYRISAVPNDPNYGQLWGLRNTGQLINSTLQAGHSYYGNGSSNPGTAGSDMAMESVWDEITDCSSVTVAVIDTGVNHDHADLAANMWDGGVSFPNHGYDFVGAGDNDPRDRNGHGTHVAGTIGAVGNNGASSTGVCWSADIMAVRVLDASGSGLTSNIILGVDFAVDNGAQVINMSLGGPGFSQAFSDAITNAQNNGVVVVVAAGNDGANNDTGTAQYPCNFTHTNLICVAALDQRYGRANFSNVGATSVDVGAPGTNILSPWAGTNQVISDPLTAGWTFTTSTAGTGWGFGSGGFTGFLFNPFNFDTTNTPTTTTYKASTDDRAYKQFSIAGVDEAFLEYFDSLNMVNDGDAYRINHRAAGGDPFSGGQNLQTWIGGNDFPSLLFNVYNIQGCISATCSIGFQITSNASGHARGVAITEFAINTLTLNTTSFNTISGTSMATPHVAGLAALIWAYNPSYTHQDVVNSIRNGGTSISALSGVTTTGRAVSGMGSLAYINPPSGLSAVVQ